MEFFLLNNDRCWGLFPKSVYEYPEEFKEYFKDVELIGKNVNIEKYLIERIGRNQLFRNEFVYPRDIGRIFYKY